MRSLPRNGTSGGSRRVSLCCADRVSQKPVGSLEKALSQVATRVLGAVPRLPPHRTLICWEQPQLPQEGRPPKHWPSLSWGACSHSVSHRS